MTTKLHPLRNMDESDDLIRARTPFRSRVRLYNRYGDFGPFVSFSGTEPCTSASGCVRASAKQGDTAFGGADEGTLVGFCCTHGNLPTEYYESLSTADFVVRSFVTPIAWHVDSPPDLHDLHAVEAWVSDTYAGLWIVPDVRYSVTTHQHQYQVHGALQGNWRNTHSPLPMQELKIEGAPERVPSGGN